MNHYCTYFDRGFLIQGLALWRSLAAQDPDAVLWVLALDDFTVDVLREVGGTWMRVVPLAELEASVPKLAAAKANRSRVEYYFTLSPCWPRWLLARHPEIERITYVDADMFFFGHPAPIFAAMEAEQASVLITGHRFPAWLRHYERHGRFNVGILSFSNDVAGRACLDDWFTRCLAWCYDRLEDGKYADQKYLDEWPARLGAALLVLEHPGVNLAPWNWSRTRWSAASPTRFPTAAPDKRVGSSLLLSLRGVGGDEAIQLDRHGSLPEPRDDSQKHAVPRVGGNAPHRDGQPLILFHFARFRPASGDRWWQSGQLDYGIMPFRLRNAIYGPYWRALTAARTEIAARRNGFDFPSRSGRQGREFWRTLPLRLACGGNWLRIGDRFFNLSLGLGLFSGRILAALRRFRSPR